MSPQVRRRIDRLLLITLALGVLVGCGQQEGCGLGQSAPYPAEGILVEQGMQARVTPDGVTALEEAVVPLIAAQLGAGSGGGFSVCVPESNASGFDICYDNQSCTDGSAGCQIDLHFHSVDLQPLDHGAGDQAASAAGTPDQLRAIINIDQFDEIITAQAVGFECVIEAWTDEGDVISMIADIDMIVDANNERLGFRFAGSDANLDNLNLNIDGKDWWDFLPCEGAGLLSGTIKGQIAAQFTPMIKDTVDSFLCMPCDAGCPGGTTCDTERNLCIEDAGGECRPQQLGYEGALSLSELLGGFGAADANPMYLSIYPADYGDSVDDGLSLGIQTGATAEHHTCVPWHDPPSGARVARSQQLEGPNDPSGQPFDAGIGVSESFIEHALWAFYTSGGICLEIGGIEQLSSGTLGILLSSLERLTDGENRPILIRFNPRQPPTATIGAGTVSQDPNTGEYVLEEPLVTVEANDLDIDLYVFAFDRYVRLMTINADVALPVGLAVTPANELIPVLGDLENALTRVEVRNAELLDDDPQVVADLLPSLIAGFLPQLAGGLTNPIALPELMGFSLTVQEITGIENNTMIGIFAGLEYVPPGGLQIATETDARLESLELPMKPYLDADGRIDWARHGILPSEVGPIATLALSGSAPAGQPGGLEYSYRIDDGLWSLFTPAERLRLAHPTLLIPGRHRIEVRSRLQGNYRTLDPTPAVLELVIDWTPPRIEEVRLDGTLARIAARDVVSAPSELRYRYRVDGGRWSAQSASPAFELAGFSLARPRPLAVEVEVTDAEGNTARHLDQLTLPALALAAAPAQDAAQQSAAPAGQEDAADCACTGVRRATGGSGLPLSAPLSVLLAALGLVWLRLRRRAARTSALALVAVAALGAAGCDDNAARQELVPDPCEDVTCPAGESCQQGQCVADSDPCALCAEGQLCEDRDGDGAPECVDAGPECTDDAQCPACDTGAGICLADGTCGCPEPQPCAGGCAGGSFCCESQDTCLMLPTECSLTCEPGFAAEQTGADASGDPVTCAITEAECECVELPELPLGRLGPYTSIALTPAGAPLVSAYSRQYGDLVLGTADDQGVLAWAFVDGVPSDAAVEGKIDGVRGGIRVPGPNVGRYTDLAIAPDGTVHVAYQDVDAEALRYARGVPDAAAPGGYTWSAHTIDDEGRSGYWASISLDPTSGAPGIAYATLEVVDGDRTLSRARYALAGSAAPGAPADWQLVTLAELDRSMPCASACEADSFCRLDTAACEAPADAASCASPCTASERCFADGCAAIAIVAPALQDWPLATGLHSAQARHADGRVVVAFYDSVGGDLWLVRQSAPGGAFDPALAIAGQDPATGADTGNQGLWPAVAIDAAGLEHLAYVDWTAKDLVYATADGAVREIVDDGARTDAFGPSNAFVGDDASLQLDDAGQPTIAYMDSTGLQLVLATRDTTSGAWVQTVLAGEGRGDDYTGAWGFYADHALAANRAWTVNFVFNQQDSPLMQALLRVQDL